LGRYRDALPALDEAERRFEGDPLATKELGRAWLTRGTVLLKMGASNDAERWLRRAVNVFAAVDDHTRLAKVRMLEAGLHFVRGDFDRARERWLAAEPAIRAGRERHALAVIWLNLGWTEIERNDAPAARHWLEKALSAFARRRYEVEVLRARWGLARLAAVFGSRADGIRELERIADELQQRGLHIDAGMVKLDLAEAYLLPPQRPEFATEICRSLPDLFQRAGASREEMKAVAFLREAANARGVGLSDVRHVRTFLSLGDEFRGAFARPEES
jgi:tetratricopeptide (TPR) repeat protein